MNNYQRRLNEYCEKFGLCKAGETCQCKKELKFIAETIHQAEQEKIKEILSWFGKDTDMSSYGWIIIQLEALLDNKE